MQPLGSLGQRFRSGLIDPPAGPLESVSCCGLGDGGKAAEATIEFQREDGQAFLCVQTDNVNYPAFKDGIMVWQGSELDSDTSWPDGRGVQSAVFHGYQPGFTGCTQGTDGNWMAPGYSCGVDDEDFPSPQYIPDDSRCFCTRPLNDRSAPLLSIELGG